MVTIVSSNFSIDYNYTDLNICNKTNAKIKVNIIVDDKSIGSWFINEHKIISISCHSNNIICRFTYKDKQQDFCFNWFGVNTTLCPRFIEEDVRII